MGDGAGGVGGVSTTEASEFSSFPFLNVSTGGIGRSSS